LFLVGYIWPPSNFHHLFSREASKVITTVTGSNAQSPYIILPFKPPEINRNIHHLSNFRVSTFEKKGKRKLHLWLKHCTMF
jgi:hypothetical protein